MTFWALCLTFGGCKFLSLIVVFVIPDQNCGVESWRQKKWCVLNRDVQGTWQVFSTLGIKLSFPIITSYRQVDGATADCTTTMIDTEWYIGHLCSTLRSWKESNGSLIISYCTILRWWCAFHLFAGIWENEDVDGFRATSTLSESLQSMQT